MFSRDWLPLTAPESFVAGLAPCEGEIWHKDGLERVQGCRHWPPNDPRWVGVSFIPHASIPSVKVSSAAEVDAIFDRVTAAGGEGLVITLASGERRKLKPKRDAEAVVVGYSAGSGRNKGIGALILAHGSTRFSISVGLSSFDRMNPPKIGALVTYEFEGLTNHGKPRSARFLRERIAA